MAWQMPLDLLYTKTPILFDYSVLTLYDLLNLLSITSVDILPLLQQDSSIALQMKKQMLREGARLVQGHPANNWQSPQLLPAFETSGSS